MQVNDSMFASRPVTAANRENWEHSRVLDEVFPSPFNLSIVGIARKSIIFEDEKTGQHYFATNRTANKVLASKEGRFNGPFCLIERKSSSGRTTKWIGICSL